MGTRVPFGGICRLQQFRDRGDRRESAQKRSSLCEIIRAGRDAHVFEDHLRDIVHRSAGLKAGIMIGNSEVGMGSVSVEPFVFRKPCTNDLIVSREKGFRHAHIHLTAYELTCRMAEAVSEGFSVASSVLDAFLKTREVKVVNPVEVIRKIAENRKFSQKLTDEVVSSYLIEPESNWFGVINSFTNAAQKLGPLQRIKMERFAGTLLQAPLQ
jgi:hypothetical protein